MYHYYYNLPSSFANFFQTVASMHSYNTRLASKSTSYINTIKTNYGEFNIRFAAVKVWNHLDESIKHLLLKTFKNKVKLNILQSYFSWVFNWSLLLLFHFSSSSFFFFFFIFLFIFLWLIICFAQAYAKALFTIVEYTLSMKQRTWTFRRKCLFLLTFTFPWGLNNEELLPLKC